jgi:hypothetical protein
VLKKLLGVTKDETTDETTDKDEEAEGDAPEP